VISAGCDSLGYEKIRGMRASRPAYLPDDEGFALDASLTAADANKPRSIAGQDWRRDHNPARSIRAVKLVRSLGCDEVIDYTAHEISEVGRRFDAVPGRTPLISDDNCAEVSDSVSPGSTLAATERRRARAAW
jgi:hypothetical protein